jgi:hypothetical protein
MWHGGTSLRLEPRSPFETSRGGEQGDQEQHLPRGPQTRNSSKIPPSQDLWPDAPLASLPLPGPRQVQTLQSPTVQPYHLTTIFVRRKRDCASCNPLSLYGKFVDDNEAIVFLMGYKKYWSPDVVNAIPFASPNSRTENAVSARTFFLPGPIVVGELIIGDRQGGGRTGLMHVSFLIP